MRFLMILSIVILASCTSRQDEAIDKIKNYPSFENVISQFYKEYGRKGLEPGEIYKFQKKPTGWHVVVLDFKKDGKGKELQNQLFWDSNSQEYVELTYGRKTLATETDLEIEKQLKSRNWESRNFQLQPYFGYSGWDSDVIALLEDKDQLSDSLLNALARAYSDHSQNLLNNNSGSAAEEDMFDLPKGKNALNEEQLSEYRKYTKLAAETFLKLELQNPEFPVLVGSINTKRSNEHMATFLNLRMYQNEEEAKKELSDDLYSAAMLSFAKNYLSSCPKNAILITAGDNDTHPLLYVQSQQGFRPDVLVMNISLLNVPRYVDHFRQPILEAQAAPFGIPQNKVDNDQLAYLFIDQTSEVEMELGDALNYALDESNGQTFGNNEDVSMLPTSNFKISNDLGVSHFTINQSFIYRADLMLLGLIANRPLDRPICFTNGHNSAKLLGLAPHLISTGLVYTFDDSTKVSNGYISIDKESLYDNLTKLYDFSSLDDIYQEDERLLNTYTLLFHQCASEFISNGNTDKAKDVLYQWEKAIGLKTKKYFMPAAVEIIKDFESIEEFETANKLKEELKSNLNAYYSQVTRKKLDESQINKIIERLDS
jgi:hypothetical protein